MLSMSNLETYSTLLEEGKRQYTNLAPKWGHASVTHEAPNAMMAKIADLEKKLSQAISPRKDQEALSDKQRRGKRLKCFRCGSDEHLIKDCPEKEDDSERKKKVKFEDDWKFKCPTDGMKEKTVSGTKYFWCGKCRKGKGVWTTSHGTAEHKVGFLKKTEGEDDDK